MTMYTAEVTRDGRWWMIEVPEINELTQARRLSEIELMAREVIAVALGVPVGEVAVDVNIGSVGAVQDVTERARKIRSERARAAELDHAASEHAAELAKQLASAQVPVRDIGTILGVSFQRAHQLVS